VNAEFFRSLQNRCPFGNYYLHAIDIHGYTGRIQRRLNCCIMIPGIRRKAMFGVHTKKSFLFG
jgi:hypothetical protein